MINKVTVMSRAEILCASPWNDISKVIISIYDPGYPAFSSYSPNVLPLGFYDWSTPDDENWRLYGNVQNLAHLAPENYFNDERANQIIDFIEAPTPPDTELIVHCHAGISRSGAVGIFASEVLGLSVADLMARRPQIDPNLYVLNKLREVYAKRKT